MNLDVGVYYYGYLGQSKKLPKVDYWEFYGKATHAIGPLTLGASVWVDGNPSIYQELARRHAASVTPVPHTSDSFDGPSTGR